jgi:dipeptidyl aminopeptidase/acylaminoacyl peptidase
MFSSFAFSFWCILSQIPKKFNFGGGFWNNPALYEKRSAMFHIKSASTPTMIHHGEADLRVPYGQGYELDNALKRQGTKVKMIAYPRQPHGIQEPRLILDAAKPNGEWFKEYLGAGK